jgi:hypothetical protein
MSSDAHNYDARDQQAHSAECIASQNRQSFIRSFIHMIAQTLHLLTIAAELALRIAVLIGWLQGTANAAP